MNVAKQLKRKKYIKNGIIYLVCMVISCLWYLIVQKSSYFCNFVLTSARNRSLLKQFTRMHVKGLIMLFQKMVLFIMLWLTVLDHMRVWRWRFLLNFYWVRIFFVFSIVNISLTMAQAYINRTIFWNIRIRTFRWVYTNCFNIYRFLCWGHHKIAKMHFFG